MPPSRNQNAGVGRVERTNFKVLPRGTRLRASGRTARATLSRFNEDLPSTNNAPEPHVRGVGRSTKNAHRSQTARPASLVVRVD